jgi:hypothetical protein
MKKVKEVKNSNIIDITISKKDYTTLDKLCKLVIDLKNSNTTNIGKLDSFIFYIKEIKGFVFSNSYVILIENTDSEYKDSFIYKESDSQTYTLNILNSLEKVSFDNMLKIITNNIKNNDFKYKIDLSWVKDFSKLIDNDLYVSYENYTTNIIPISEKRKGRFAIKVLKSKGILFDNEFIDFNVKIKFDYLKFIVDKLLLEGLLDMKINGKLLTIKSESSEAIIFKIF